jgi:hypothetical protein
MGDPTHRHYRMRQRDFCGILAEMCEQAYRIRCLTLDYWLPMGEEFKIVTSAPDISRADNGALASAAAGIVGAFATMKQNGWIDDETAIRLAFQFAGEIVSDEEIEKILQEAKDVRGLTGEQGSPSGGAGRGTAVEADSVYSVKTGRPIWYD